MVEISKELGACGLAHAHLDPTNYLIFYLQKEQDVVEIKPIELRITCMECPFPDCMIERVNSDRVKVKLTNFKKYVGAK